MNSGAKSKGVDTSLAKLFSKVPAPIAVRPKTPAAPNTVRLTGDVATDARLLADAYALRDAEELRVGHSILLVVLDP